MTAFAVAQAAWRRRALVACAGIAVGLAARAETSMGRSLGRAEGLPPGGESTVDLSNGAFKYDVAFDVPDFRDLEPELALRYDSSRANGLAGIGWRLDGFSVIQRAAVDSGGSRRCAASDVFLLDGEPLVPCTSLGGTHCTKAQDYRRIAFDAAKDGWTVWTRDGTRLSYARLAAPDAGSCTERYGIASAEDTRGNKVAYGWWTDDAAGADREAYPSTVSYAGVTVALHHELRPDVITYGDGVETTRQRYRLRSLVVSVNTGGPAGGGETKVLRAWSFDYQAGPNTGRSQLVTVTRYGRDAVVDGAGGISKGAALTTQRFSYVGGQGNGFPGETTWGGLSDANGWSDARNYLTIQTPDVDGDGRRDVCARSDKGIACWRFTGSGWSPFPRIQGTPEMADSNGWGDADHYTTIHFPDLNGDGKADVCGRSGTGLRCWLNDGTSNPAFVTAVPRPQLSDGSFAFSDDLGWAAEQYYSSIQFADVNGDGRDDVCYRSSGGVGCWLSTGTSFSKIVSGPAWTNALGWSDPSNYRTVRFVDINGDGKADVCGRANKGIVCHLANGNGFDATEWQGPGLSDAGGWNKEQYYATIQFADVNGDGMADVCARAANGVHCYLATGSARTRAPFTAFSATDLHDPSQADARGYDAVQYYSSIQLADLDGDGRAELCWRAHDGIYAARLRDGAFTRVITAALPGLSSSVGWSDPANYRTLRFLDIDGDGKADVFVRANAGLRVYRSPGDGTERLAAVTDNGLGGKIEVAYTPSSAFPRVNNPPIDWVVTAVTYRDGRGGAAVHRYAYSGGLIDWTERRNVGFRYVKHTLPALANERAAPYEESWFMQRPYACVGKVDLRRRSSGAGNRLEEVSRTFAAAGSGAGPFTCQLTAESHLALPDAAGVACTSADHARCKRSDVAFQYDAYGNTVAVLDHGDFWDTTADDRTTAYTFQPNVSAWIVGRPKVVQTYAGIGTAGTLVSETHHYYDGATTLDVAPRAGLATMERRWVSALSSGGGAAWVSTEREHDAVGNVTAEIDPLGHRVEYVYESIFRRFPIRVRNALGQETRTTWDPVCGLPLTETDRNGLDTTHQYDAHCRPTRTDRPGGGFELRSYSALGDPAAQSVRVETPGVAGLAGNHYAISTFDGLGRVFRVRTRGPDGTAATELLTDATLDARGNLRTLTLPHAAGETVTPATYDYDALDRQVLVTLADGSTIEDRREPWKVTHLDEDRRLTIVETFDAAGRLVTHLERGASDALVRHAYDVMGRRVKTTDPAGNVSTVEYNSAGDVLAQVDPDRGRVAFEHDATGRVVASTDARGVTTRFAYDALGRLTSKTASGAGLPVLATRWAYDEARDGFFNVGGMTTMTDGAGSERYDHDAAGRIVSEVRTLDGVSYAHRHAYDAAGRLLGTRYPDGDVIGADPVSPAAGTPLGYDGAGRLTSIPGFVAAVTYEPWGDEARITLANGTTSERTHDPRRAWLTAIRTARGGAVLQDLKYTRDAAGRIVGVSSTAPGAVRTYTYDALGRLTRATAGSPVQDDQQLAYDDLGNIQGNSRLGAYTYPPAGAARPHAPTAVAGVAWTYDAAGNTLSDGRRAYSWDAEGRLAGVSVAGVATTFVYDGEGRRLAKTRAGQTTRTIGDDYELAPDGTVTKYVTLGDALVAKKVGAERFWIHADHQGSVRVVTDATGAEVQREEFRAYGGSLESSGVQAQSRTFIGERTDETGLVYLHARYYDPEAGRFLSPDALTPGERIVGLNRYAYGFDDPVNWVDRNGQFGIPKFMQSKTFWVKAGFFAAGTVLTLSGVGAGLGGAIIVGAALGGAESLTVGLMEGKRGTELARDVGQGAVLGAATNVFGNMGGKLYIARAGRHVAERTGFNRFFNGAEPYTRKGAFAEAGAGTYGTVAMKGVENADFLRGPVPTWASDEPELPRYLTEERERVRRPSVGGHPFPPPALVYTPESTPPSPAAPRPPATPPYRYRGLQGEHPSQRFPAFSRDYWEVPKVANRGRAIAF